MRIKSKVNLLIITTVAILFTGLIAGLFFFSIDGLTDIEKHESLKHYVTAENYLYYKISSLDQTGRDWAYWDSSYYFMDDKNSEYILENLPESSFINLDINAILFFDANGGFFYGRYYDLKKGIFTEIPDSLVNALMQNSFVKNPSAAGSSSGFVEADGEIYMVSINPLLKSSLKGPAKGTFVMAKLLSGDYFVDISHEINLNVDFSKISDNGYSDMIFKGNIPNIVYNEEGDELSVISPLYDINKNAVGVLKIAEERDLFRLGINSLLLHLAVAILTCLMIIIIINYFLDSIIIKRLEFFSSELERIAKDNDYSSRLREEDDDEISSIISSANILLGTIQSNIENLEKNNRELNRTLLKKSDLIGELHHRVKNNLQYIISLIGIKSLKVKDETALEIINETTNRIKYLGMIHDDLYNKEDKESLMFKEHLYELTNLILNGVSKEKREKISVQIKGDELEAELSYAIPLSTAMYELLKNSVEHAFDENGGNIEIKLFKDDKCLEIIISDDGRGIQNSDSQKFSFGLINAREIITKQLFGTIESIDAEKGTSWKIIINPDLNKEKRSNLQRDDDI